MKIIIPNLCFIVPLNKFRTTPNVSFETIPMIKDFSELDIVEHKKWAYSPSIKKDKELKPWYMHPHQIDNLVVFKWERFIDLYSKEYTKIEHFEVSNNTIKHNWEIIYRWKAIFWRYTNVFHRVYSPEWSISLNLAQQMNWFDINTNFNIYDLDTKTSKSFIIREWHLDQ